MSDDAIGRFGRAVLAAIDVTELDSVAISAVLLGIISTLLQEGFELTERRVIVNDACALLRAATLESREAALAVAEAMAARSHVH